jgi:LPXTG-motif cell wall-anchored protein
MNGTPPDSGAIPDFNYILFGAILVALLVALVVWFRRR